MMSTSKTYIQEFYSTFQITQADLLSRVDALKAQPIPSHEDVNALAADVVKLRKNLSDATSFLPPYDQRQYEQGVKSLEQSLEELRSSSTAKPKFSFKRKAQKPPSIASSVLAGDPQRHEQPSTQPEIVRSSNSVSLSAHERQYLSWSSVPTLTVSTTDLSISDLDHCIVNLQDNSLNTQSLVFTALHIRNVRNSVLLLPSIQGSAMIHDMKNCVAVLSCHQFRMHTSSQVDVYSSIESNPIIEHCSNLRFSGYPIVLQRDSPLEKAQHTNQNLAVQDFSHIRATPSPNWTILEPQNCITADRWREISATADRNNVSLFLTGLLPQPAS